MCVCVCVYVSACMRVRGTVPSKVPAIKRSPAKRPFHWLLSVNVRVCVCVWVRVCVCCHLASVSFRTLLYVHPLSILYFCYYWLFPTTPNPFHNISSSFSFPRRYFLVPGSCLCHSLTRARALTNGHARYAPDGCECRCSSSLSYSFFFVCVFCVTYPPPFWFALSCLVFALCPSVFPYFSSIPLSVAFPLRPDPPRLLPLLWLLRLLLPLFPLIRCGSCNTTAFFSCLVHLFFSFCSPSPVCLFLRLGHGLAGNCTRERIKKNKNEMKRKIARSSSLDDNSKSSPFPPTRNGEP